MLARPRRPIAGLALVLALAAGPALARSQDKPITDRSVDAEDVAKTPLTDLNLSKDEIPALLIDAQLKPYDLAGLGKCRALVAEVEKFNAVLGPDLDLPQDAEARVSAGRVAKSVVGSFIPFRGILREITGANNQDRKVRAAIDAGLARRGFLKGVGATRGCAYPARPASAKDVSAFISTLSEEDIKAVREARDRKETKDSRDTGFTSKPVVQKTD